MILVDTPVWSRALRRAARAEDPYTQELRKLIAEGRAAIIGAIRQELLCGIRTEEQFVLLQERLRDFPDVPAVTHDYEEAARYFNRCRQRGIQGSNTDFLICAISSRHQMPVFTADHDFLAFARILPFALHTPRA